MEPALTEYGLNDSQIAVLNQQTPPFLVRQRKGRGGKQFAYLPHEEVTRILNSAFGHSWNLEVKQFGTLEKMECWALVRLTVQTDRGEITKEQFGQCDYLKNKQGAIVMSTGDCLKGAVSDGLTKCASLLGIGLDLYGVTAQERRSEHGNGSDRDGGSQTKRELAAQIDQLKGVKLPTGEGAFVHFKKKLAMANGNQQQLDELSAELYQLMSGA
jgi:hypothetical protein